jgi:ankyrin repeat protein
MTGGHIDIARILLGAGANSNGPPEEQRESLHFMTPLQAAVAHGSVEPVEFLLDNGADPNGRDSRGRSAVHSAALLPDEKVGILKLLLDRDANPDAQEDDDSTPLAMAAMMGRTEAVRKLLAHGADASVRALGGQTALQFAKSGGHMEIIGLLEQASAKSGQES